MSRPEQPDWERDLSLPPLRERGFSTELIQGVQQRLERKKERKRYRQLVPLAAGVGATALAVLLIATMSGSPLPWALHQEPDPQSSAAFDANQRPSDPQELVLWKMRYSIYLLQSVKGKLERSDPSGQVTVVDFAVREGAQPACWELEHGSNLDTTEHVRIPGFDVTKRNGVIVDAKKVSASNSGSGSDSKSRSSVTPNPDLRTSPPDLALDPAGTLYAREAVAPLSSVQDVLRDRSRWHITGTETLLDRPTTAIAGTLETAPSANMSPQTFKLWVDQETGMLLKRILYDASGNVIETFKLRELQVNRELPEATFQLAKDALNSAS